MEFKHSGENILFIEENSGIPIFLKNGRFGEYTEFDGFNIINASSTIFNDDMYVSLFIKNLTNERGTTGAFLNEAFGPQPSQGFYGSNSREFYALPRTIGFSISRGF